MYADAPHMSTGSPADVAAAVARRAAAKAALTAAASKAQAAIDEGHNQFPLTIELDEPIHVEAGDTIDVPLLDFNKATMREPVPSDTDDYIPMPPGAQAFLESLGIDTESEPLTRLDGSVLDFNNAPHITFADEPEMEDWEKDVRAEAEALLDAAEAAEQPTEDDEPETMDAGLPGQIYALGENGWGWQFANPTQRDFLNMVANTKPSPHGYAENIGANTIRYRSPNGQVGYYDATTGERLREAVEGPPGPMGPAGLDGRDGHDTRLTAFLADTVTLLDGCTTNEDLALIDRRVEAALDWFGCTDADVENAYSRACQRATLSAEMDRVHERLVTARTEDQINKAMDLLNAVSHQSDATNNEALIKRCDDLCRLADELQRPFIHRRLAKRVRRQKVARRWWHLKAALLGW